jgi:hypothetical protein
MTASPAQVHPTVVAVTDRIIRRSAGLRRQYLARMHTAIHDGPARAQHGCANLAHGFAAAGPDKAALRSKPWPNIAIVSAYNEPRAMPGPSHNLRAAFPPCAMGSPRARTPWSSRCSAAM